MSWLDQLKLAFTFRCSKKNCSDSSVNLKQKSQTGDNSLSLDQSTNNVVNNNYAGPVLSVGNVIGGDNYGPVANRDYIDATPKPSWTEQRDCIGWAQLHKKIKANNKLSLEQFELHKRKENVQANLSQIIAILEDLEFLRQAFVHHGEFIPSLEHREPTIKLYDSDKGDEISVAQRGHQLYQLDFVHF